MTHPLDDSRLDWDFLRKYNFDEDRFRADQATIVSGELTTSSATVTGTIRPAPEVTEVVFDASAVNIQAQGEQALKAGEVAHVVLNGGMATRFGGVVKGVVEVFDGKSFIGLKAEDCAQASKHFGAPVPLVLMNSFATDASTRQHIADNQGFGLSENDILYFQQSISVRMNEDGSLFVGDDGRPSYHAPGHGDFFNSIRASGVLAQLKERGVKYLIFSNVDNLGATIDPVVVGHHVASGKAMSAEVTQKQRTASGAWDKGGAPAQLESGLVQVVEGFRFPADFAQETLPDFSTNNMMFTLEALDQEVRLDRYLVKKKVDGRPALQLESITCEASGVLDVDGKPLLPVNLLRVPREGEFGRFFPVKEPIDLDASRDKLKARLLGGWARLVS